MSSDPNLSQQLGDIPEVTLPQTQQQVAQKAFESAVTPLREEFKESLGTTVESLAQRGIAFGGVGGERLGDIFQEQQKLEAGVAGGLAATLGQSALEQAFAASEAAKSRQLQTQLQKSGFTFQTRERAGREEFAAAQSEKERSLKKELLETSGTQKETLLEKELEAGVEQREDIQAFELGRLGEVQKFQSIESALDRALTSTENDRSRAAASELQQQGFTAQEAFQKIANDFSAEQALLGRSFNELEALKQREFQEVFQANREEFSASQQELATQEERNRTAIQLALSGNLKGANVETTIQELFGDNVKLTTQDDADLQRIATAAGLSTEEYKDMRSAIGQGQLAAVLNNPADFVDSPAKARDFQFAMALIPINAQREANGLAPKTLDDLKATVPEESGGTLTQSGILATQKASQISELNTKLDKINVDLERGSTVKTIEQLNAEKVFLESKISELGG